MEKEKYDVFPATFRLTDVYILLSVFCTGEGWRRSVGPIM